ncbi:hypothetical protein [Arenimonas sp.]|uniref:hypothetical protein n=1 Tax=Arenimonas sp. TaxID=1872635 RepID=UPI0039E53D01
MLTLSKTPSPDLLASLDRLLAAASGLPVLLVAHGDGETQDERLRSFADARPSLNLLMHARRVSTDQAMKAGLATATTAWVAWVDLDRRHVDADSILATAIAGTDDVASLDWFRAENGVLVFPCDAWAKLPRMSWMTHVLPELLEQAGLVRRDTKTVPPWQGWIDALLGRLLRHRRWRLLAPALAFSLHKAVAAPGNR